jgi:hypothetical protein
MLETIEQIAPKNYTPELILGIDLTLNSISNLMKFSTAIALRESSRIARIFKDLDRSIGVVAYRVDTLYLVIITSFF